MTHDELRDELARAMGWENIRVYGNLRWVHASRAEQIDHPVERTADAALAAFERLLPGWTWQCNDGNLFAFWPLSPTAKPGVHVKRTGNFAHDICALTLAAVRAKGGEA